MNVNEACPLLITGVWVQEWKELITINLGVCYKVEQDYKLFHNYMYVAQVTT